MQSYLNALQSTQMSSELINQGLEMAQQKREATMPLSELSLGEGAKALGEQVLSYAKTQGTQLVKDAIRSKMKDAGIDEDTINSTLEGDLNLDTLTSKVGSLISKAKSSAQDLVGQAQSKVEGAVSDLQSTAQDLVGQAQSQVEGLKQTLTDSLDNIDTTVRSNIADAQGIADDLTSQALQEYNSIRNITEPTLMEAETGTSNLFSRVSNFFQSQPAQPSEIEMVNFADVAPEVSSTIAPEIGASIAPELSTTLSSASEAVTGAVSSAVSSASEAVTGAVAGLEGVSAGLDATGILAPLGAIASVALGIFGIVEAEKSPQEQAPILNPSSQFL